MVCVKWFSLILVALNLCACSHLPANTNPFKTQKEETLFKRIGGMPVINEMVDQFIDEVAKSPRTKRSFDGIKLKALKESVAAQLCNLTGGGCVYEGETMLNSHRDAKITEAEFDAFVDIFRNTLNRYLPTKEKNELLKILAPMKRDIVTQ